MTDKLLPCPFCGGTADYREASVWWVRCDSCGADAQPGTTREEAGQLWNRRFPPAPLEMAVTEAARRYLAAIDSEPENDIWDTWDGKPSEGAPKMASDASWSEHGQKIESCLSELRAALAISTEVQS